MIKPSWLSRLPSQLYNDHTSWTILGHFSRSFEGDLGKPVVSVSKKRNIFFIPQECDLGLAVS